MLSVCFSSPVTIIFLGFGCAGNAFSYSALHSQTRSRRSCADLDSFNLMGDGETSRGSGGYNPNIFPDTENIKDNRLQSVFGDTEKNVNNKELIKSPGEETPAVLSSHFPNLSLTMVQLLLFSD